MRLAGIDGSHLFGFMAALGIHSLLDRRARTGTLPPPRMAFSHDFMVSLSGLRWTEDQLIDVLFDGLQRSRIYFEKDLAGIDKPADFTAESFQELAEAADLQASRVLAGLACWTGHDIFESTLCAANGAGHQELIRSIRDVLALVQKDHLRAALFTPWRRSYEMSKEDRKRLNLGSRKPTLRLDPADERLYALRADNPTPATSNYRTELGGQALAVAGFSILPVVPRRRPLTVASVRDRNRVYFTWHLWSYPSTLASTRSLLVAKGVQRELEARGVFAAFRVARVAGAKGRLSFAPSEGLWWSRLASIDQPGASP